MSYIDWEILANHLTGQVTGNEEKKLSEWLAESSENREFFDRLKKLWLAEQKVLDRPDTEKALKLVLSRIEQPSAARQHLTPRIPATFAKRSITEFLTRPMYFRAAALLAVAIGAFALYAILSTKGDVGTSTVTFTRVQTLQLPDGTRITFDVGSSFTFPRSFEGADAREVTLDGEAYFEVTHDDRHPFTVHANRGTITVLGTSFAIRSWKKDENVVVAVKEGRVSFQPEANNATGKIVYLTQNMMSRLSMMGGSPTPAEAIDFSAYLSWMKREIYFRSTPVPVVLRQLERWYNVTILAADSSMLHENITVFIANKPLIENLNLLSVLVNASVELRGDTVRFVPR